MIDFLEIMYAPTAEASDRAALPVIDISPFVISNASAEDKLKTAQKLHEACIQVSLSTRPSIFSNKMMLTHRENVGF